MSHWRNKRERIELMINLLETTSVGLGGTELANCLGCSRETAQRDLKSIKEIYDVVEDPPDSGKYRMNFGQNIRNVRLHPYEALTIYLALRRFIRQTNAAPNFMINAIRKIIHAVARPELVDNLVAASDFLQEHRSASNTDEKIWADLIDAWLNNRIVRIAYHKPGDTEPFVHTSEVYLFEPMPYGDGIYVIIWSRERAERDGDGLRQLKIDRIKRVTPTMETFEPRLDLDIDRLIKHALGVWFTTKNKIPCNVVLRFAPDKASRVMESVYIEVEEKILQEDGSLIWRAQVANLREVQYWVLGWGAGVEVLEPAELRHSIANELRAAAKQYNL
jgi:CRISPR-associated endonuclease/helicase Cas3